MAQIKQIEVNGVIYDVTGGGGHEIDDSEGTSLTQRDTLQFGEGLLAEDDSVNEKTIVLPDAASAEDISEIVSPLPGAVVKRMKYSTEEQVVAEWIDGKPVYQKTLVANSLNQDGNVVITHGISNFGELIKVTDVIWYDDSDARWRSGFRFWTNYTTSYSIGLGGCSCNSTTFRLDNEMGSTNTINWSTRTSNVRVTIQYTKTTD